MRLGTERRRATLWLEDFVIEQIAQPVVEDKSTFVGGRRVPN